MYTREDTGWLTRNGFIGLVVGLGVLGGAGWVGREPYRIWRTWPTVEAEATRGDIASDYERHVVRKGYYTVYRAQVEFRYRFGGKEHVAWSSTSSTSASSKKIWRKLATTYAPGRRLRIHYNPANPAEIRLDLFRDSDDLWMFVALLGLGFVFCAAGFNALRLARRAAVEGGGP